jgi:hypothetical protein
MMGAGGEQTQSLEKFAIPYSKEVELFHVVYENGFPILRLRIREGKRFTMVDLDAASAEHWGEALLKWANDNRSKEGE